MTPQKRTPGGNRANGIHSGQLQRNSTTPPAELLLPRLDRVKQTGPDSWLACCPAHDDRSPSLSVKQAEDRLLLHCFAGCEVGDVLAAVGLSLADLFDRPLAHHKAPLSAYQRRRHGQAADAMKALQDELGVIAILSEQIHAGFALDPAERERLELAMSRVKNAREVAA